MILMYIRPSEITHDFIHTFFAVKTRLHRSWDWGMYTDVVQSDSLSFYLIFRLLLLKQQISHLNFAMETRLWVCESMCIMFLFICQENRYFSFMCLLLYHLIFTSLYISIYLSDYVAIYLSRYPSIFPSMFLSIYLSSYQPTYLHVACSLSQSLSLSLFVILWGISMDELILIVISRGIFMDDLMRESISTESE